MLIVKLKSETLKNVHLKPEIKYTTGLNIDNFCQNRGSIDIEQKLPPKNTRGVTINIGTRFSCSKFLAHKPITKPNKQKVIQVSKRKLII